MYTKLRSVILWTGACLATGALAMAVTPPASQAHQPVFSVTHPDPGASSMHEKPGTTTTRAILKTFHKDGTVAHKYVYGPKTEGKQLRLPKALSLTGSGSSNNDPIKFSITQTQHGMLGEQLWWFKIWTNWHWDISGLDHYVHVDSTGTDWATDAFWDFDKAKMVKSMGPYMWCCGVSNSGYKHMKKGHFNGPALGGGINATCEPKLTIRSHSNGSWTWESLKGC